MHVDPGGAALLYDALFTVSLPSTLGPSVPTPPWEALERWLFTGRARRRMACCAHASAAVLAGLHGSLRQAPLEGRPQFTVSSDADEVLDLAALPEGWDRRPHFAASLPERWTTEPCAFRLRATWEEGGFAHVVQARLTPRHDPEQTAVTGSVRALWVPEARGERLARRLRSAGDARELERRLHEHGRRVTRDTLTRVEARLGGPTSWRSRVLVLVEGPFDDLLAGFPEAAIDAVPEVTRLLQGTWPALSAEGVEGRVRNGRFESMAIAASGVADVV